MEYLTTQETLSGQKDEDRPDLTTRVCKQKLEEFTADITTEVAVSRMVSDAGGRLIMETDNKGAAGYISRGQSGMPQARVYL